MGSRSLLQASGGAARPGTPAAVPPSAVRPPGPPAPPLPPPGGVVAAPAAEDPPGLSAGGSLFVVATTGVELNATEAGELRRGLHCQAVAAAPMALAVATGWHLEARPAAIPAQYRHSRSRQPTQHHACPPLPARAANAILPDAVVKQLQGIVTALTKTLTISVRRGRGPAWRAACMQGSRQGASLPPRLINNGSSTTLPWPLFAALLVAERLFPAVSLEHALLGGSGPGRGAGAARLPARPGHLARLGDAHVFRGERMMHFNQTPAGVPLAPGVLPAQAPLRRGRAQCHPPISQARPQPADGTARRTCPA